jgi:hypothetical protein
MNKKGNFSDVVEYIKVAFLLAFIILIVSTVVIQFNDRVQSDNVIFDNETQITSENFKNATVNGWDVFFVILSLIFIIFSFIMARLIPSSPKFIILSFFVLLLMPFGAMIFENIWDGLDQGILAITMNEMSFIPFIMDHFVWVIVMYSFLVALALLTKTETGVIK